jgi:putative tryptophan/tyrosine transport system substrate-binding protein
MRRREFIAGLGAAAWPVRAQPAESVRLIGVLAYPGSEAFKPALAAYGWAVNRNIRFEERYSNDNDEMIVRAAELARFPLDAIFVTGSPALRAMRHVSGGLPIIFAAVRDPVEQGFVSSFARPGGNITGFASGEFGAATKQLDLLTKLAPSVQRVAVLFDPAQSTSGGFWAEIEAAAPGFNLKAFKVPVRNAGEIERALASISSPPDTGLVVVSGLATRFNRDTIALSALQHRLPIVCAYRYYVESGALASYGPDQIDLFRRAASYVDRILRGEKPRDLPVQFPTRFELALNLKTAKAIGLNISANVLALADEVIE